MGTGDVHAWYMSPLRENQLKILLSDEELVMLKELAEAKGLDVSNYLRSLIRDQHVDRNTPAPVAAFMKKLERLAGPDHPKVKEARSTIRKRLTKKK
jgi:hypothetical protein